MNSTADSGIISYNFMIYKYAWFKFNKRTPFATGWRRFGTSRLGAVLDVVRALGLRLRVESAASGR